MLEIRTAHLDDMAVFLDWAAEEGWNPGYDDGFPFHQADPRGFFVGHVNGQPAAAVSVVCSGDTHAFLGFYICHPLHRGKGYGMAIWKHGLSHAGPRSVGLDGVVAQQANYAKSGFVLAWNNVRYGGVLRGSGAPSPLVRDVQSTDLPALIDYDAPRYGARREAFLSSWLHGAATRHSFMIERDGRIAGYCTLRRCRHGIKIGPLFAESRAQAEALLDTAAKYADGAEIFLDVPQANAEAVKLAEARGLTPRFETARMYRGPAPAVPLKTIFGVTTFELG